MVDQYQVGIIGGGLAGLCAALHLNKLGYSVILWEKGEYPRHKVCGEYVSNETLAYLNFLGFDPFELGAVKINELKVTHWDGNFTVAPLEQGAFGISRYLFDFHLYQLCVQNGVDARLLENVTGYEKLEKGYKVKTSSGKTARVEIIISAHGKKSNMDRIMDREFFQKDADFIGVKYHFNYQIPSHLVSLNNFETGYCGVSMIEDKKVNVCYLSTKSALKKYGSIEGLEENLVRKNPLLNDVFTNGEKLFDEPKTISDFTFKPKEPVEDGIIMAGDSAGLITPLCGNGMAMAIHAAFIASRSIDKYLKKQLTKVQLDKTYAYEWKKAFHSRLKMGYLMQKMMGKEKLSTIAMKSLQVAPFLLPTIVKKTSGKDFYQS